MLDIKGIQLALVEDLVSGRPMCDRNEMRAVLVPLCKGVTHESLQALQGFETSVCDSPYRFSDEYLYFARFLKKFRDLPPLDTTDTTLESFIRRQDSLLTGFNPSKELDFASRIGRVVSRGYRLHWGDCHHGPGATSEKMIGVDKSWYQLPLKAKAIDPLHRLNQSWCNPVETTRIAIVPKDWRKGRVIGIEPVWNMARQLSLKECLERVTSDFIPYHDQRSHWSVLLSAPYESLVTVDLSNASDHISVQLAEFLIDPLLFRQAMDLRTETFTTSLGRFRTESFALMGNGFCFPFLSIIVWSLGVAATLLSEGVSQGSYPLTRAELIRFAKVRKISVFGDDLILPHYAFPFFRALTTSAGLVINESKSGLGDFRETCGIYRFLNRNPFRCDYLKFGQVSGESIAGLCALQNSLFKGGHLRSAQFLAEQLDVPSICYRHYRDDQAGLFCITEECRCTTKWNRRRSRYVHRVCTAQIDVREISLGDSSGWWQAFHGGIPLVEPVGQHKFSLSFH